MSRSVSTIWWNRFSNWSERSCTSRSRKQIWSKYLLIVSYVYLRYPFWFHFLRTKTLIVHKNRYAFVEFETPEGAEAIWKNLRILLLLLRRSISYFCPSSIKVFARFISYKFLWLGFTQFSSCMLIRENLARSSW